MQSIMRLARYRAGARDSATPAGTTTRVIGLNALASVVGHAPIAVPPMRTHMWIAATVTRLVADASSQGDWRETI